jgi:cysteine synthase A
MRKRVNIVFDLLQEEGCAWAARAASTLPVQWRWPRNLGPGHTIVTILCDYGNRYQSKLYNPAFLRSKDLPVPAWLERPVDVPDVSVDPEAA